MFFWATFTPKNTYESLQGSPGVERQARVDSKNDGGGGGTGGGDEAGGCHHPLTPTMIGSWRMLALRSRGEGDKCGVAGGRVVGS